MNQNGFSMVEMIIVLLIIGMMATTIVPSAMKYEEHKKEKELANYTYVLKKTMRQYYALEGKYPEKDKNNTPILQGYRIIIDPEKYEYTYNPKNPSDLNIKYK